MTTPLEHRETAADPGHPGREAWELMLELLPRIRTDLMAACAELDLTPAQAGILKSLDPARPLPMTALANVHSCDASNITALVDRLEARGLIARTPNPADRRVRMIAVTPAGARLRARLLERIHQPPPFVVTLSAADQRRLRDILRKATRSVS